MIPNRLIVVTSGVFACISCSLCRADINGFGDYASQWHLQRLDHAPVFAITDNSLQLTTDSGGSQNRSFFYLSQQNITKFRASFTYQAGTANGSSITGLALVLFTNDEAADGTLSGGNNGSWGFASNGAGVPLNQNILSPSVAIVLSLPPNTAANGSKTGVCLNGQIGSSLSSTEPVNLGLSRLVEVDIRYNQPGDMTDVLYQKLTDPITGDVYETSTLLSIPTVLSSNMAFVGFTTYCVKVPQAIRDFSFLDGSSCASDFTADGTRDVADLFAFINAWLAKDILANFNQDEQVDVADLFAFINAWLAGC